MRPCIMCAAYYDVQMQRKSWQNRKDVVRQPFVTPIHFALVIIVISTVIIIKIFLAFPIKINFKFCLDYNILLEYSHGVWSC